MSSCERHVYGAEFDKRAIELAVNNGRLLSMEIEFNQLCNFQCVYCYAAKTADPKNELTLEEAQDVILQARELDAKKIIILGGEPMLYRHAMDMIGFIRDLGMTVEMFTNGANMTAENAKRLYELGVTVALKMNTFDEKLQDMLSGKKGAYLQIQEAFRNLKSAGYPAPGHEMGVSTVICRQNLAEIVTMWRWLRERNLNPYFEMITPQGNACENDNLYVEPDRLGVLFHELAVIDREYGHQWTPQPPLVGGECLRHRFSCAVNALGDVQPCVGVTIPVGNIRQNRLKDILRESEVIRDLKSYRKNMKGPCRQCDQLDNCYGCRGAAFQMTGDYLASDPLCWRNIGRQAEIVKIPVSASVLVPHAAPMLMITRLVEIGERSATVEMDLAGDNIFLGEDGLLSGSAYVELVAQAIAAQNGFRSMGGERNGSKEGLLIGVKDFVVQGEARAGDCLRIHVKKVGTFGDFCMIKGEVFNGELSVAFGEIKIWQKDSE